MNPPNEYKSRSIYYQNWNWTNHQIICTRSESLVFIKSLGLPNNTYKHGFEKEGKIEKKTGFELYFIIRGCDYNFSREATILRVICC